MTYYSVGLIIVFSSFDSILAFISSLSDTRELYRFSPSVGFTFTTSKKQVLSSSSELHSDSSVLYFSNNSSPVGSFLPLRFHSAIFSPVASDILNASLSMNIPVRSLLAVAK